MPYTAPAQTVKDLMPGGFPDVAPASSPTAWRRLNVALTTATSPLTSTLTLPKVIQRGKIRIRVSNVAVIAGTFAFTVTGTDGTNTEDLGTFTASSSIAITTSLNGVERVFEFISELLLTSISVIATQTGASGTSTLDWEVFGQP